MRLNFYQGLMVVFLFSACSVEPMFDHQEATALKKITLNISKNGYPSYKLANMLDRKKSLMEAHLSSNARLNITIKESYDPVGYTSDGDVNRVHGSIIIDIVLIQEGKPEKKTRLDCVSSYNISDEFTNDQAKEQVQNRLLNSLSNQIIRKTICLMD